jgi:hypothetical protein
VDILPVNLLYSNFILTVTACGDAKRWEKMAAQSERYPAQQARTVKTQPDEFASSVKYEYRNEAPIGFRFDQP